jgi:hypothetical protein
VWRLHIPRNYYFDEVYHAFTSLYYAVNDPKGYEWWHSSPEKGTAFEWLHPPVAKLIMGFSIFMFGDNSYAWRLFSSVFGVLVIVAVYLLAKELFGSRKMALVAALVASFDGLMLAMSRIAMNDIYVTFFMLMALYSYRRAVRGKGSVEKWLLVGVFAGLAAATKWSGVFVIALIGMWEVGRRWMGLKDAGRRRMAIFGAGLLGSGAVGVEVFTRLEELMGVMKWVVEIWLGGLLALVAYWLSRVVGWKHLARLVLVLVVIPGVIYLVAFGQFWLQGHTVAQFKELHRQIWWYQTNLEATHPYQSKPWQWVLNLKPVWFYVNYQEGDHPGAPRGGAGAPAGGGECWYKTTERSVGIPGGGLSVGVAAVDSFSQDHVLLPLHAGDATSRDSDGGNTGEISRDLEMGEVGRATGVAFIYFYPHWTGIVVPNWWAEKYFWFETWR